MIKQEHILEAAIRRFAHFGVNKTTMTEIAEDLSISKQSLFYYVPDKQSLIKAIEEKIVGEYITALKEHFNNAANVESALLKLIEIKKAFFEKYSLLLIQAESMEAMGSTGTIAQAKQKAKEKETQLIAQLLQKGVEQEELKPIDAKGVGALLLDILAAFEYCVIGRISVPDHKYFDALFNKQKEVLQLIMNGLKRSEWKN